MARFMLLGAIVLALGGATVAHAQPVTEVKFVCAGTVTVETGQTVGYDQSAGCFNVHVLATINGHASDGVAVEAVTVRNVLGSVKVVLTSAPKNDVTVTYLGFRIPKP